MNLWFDLYAVILSDKPAQPDIHPYIREHTSFQVLKLANFAWRASGRGFGVVWYIS